MSIRSLTHLCMSLLCLLLAPATTLAHPQGSSADYVVDVVDAQGRNLPTYHHRGQTFVLGHYGHRYAVRVYNQTGRRVEAVVTVDGRDVVSGEEGDYTRQRGYVIDAYGMVEIEGFRRSHRTVATFRFTDPGDAYSSRMGTPQHVGVIGVAVFPERVHHTVVPRPRPRRYVDDELRNSYGSGSAGSAERARKRSGASPSAPSAAAEPSRDAHESMAESRVGGMQRDNLGTRYGENRDSHSRDVRFHRASPARPAAVISLRYDDRDGLVSRGIDLHPHRPVVRNEPSPFPYNRFAPPPPR